LCRLTLTPTPLSPIPVFLSVLPTSPSPRPQTGIEKLALRTRTTLLRVRTTTHADPTEGVS